jgi:hypothetical protein
MNSFVKGLVGMGSVLASLSKKENVFQKTLLWGVCIVIAMLCVGCLTQAAPLLAPNASQGVVTIKRADSSINKNRDLEIYLDGRKEGAGVKSGDQGQVLVMNGLHNIQVKILKDSSQLLTFEASSDVIEFYVNYEGSGRKKELNIIKMSGGNGNANKNSNSSAPAPVINIQVDNSSKNSSSSDNSSVVGD